MQRLRLTSLLLLFCSAFAVALPTAKAANSDNAKNFIDTIARDALNTISSKTLPKSQKQAKLESIFSRNVDIAWVGRFVMGRFWREASEPQRKRYLKAYEQFIITHYAARFTEYTSGDYTIVGVRDDTEDSVIVSMEIATGTAGDPPVLIDYRVREDKGGYKVFDIIIEGVSMITTQRSEFASILGAQGVDGLISQLENRSITISDKK